MDYNFTNCIRDLEKAIEELDSTFAKKQFKIKELRNILLEQGVEMIFIDGRIEHKELEYFEDDQLLRYVGLKDKNYWINWFTNCLVDISMDKTFAFETDEK